MSTLHDPLQLPLDGIRAVEANAGTGKTFTIAALYLRLILENGLKPEEVVVATFTRAATAVLSERLRAWLALAEHQLREDEPDRQRDGEHDEAAMLRRIIAQARDLRALAGDADPRQTLRGRAREASLAIDTAQIFTLHGFCFRVLAEFGFDANTALRRPELVEDLRALDLEITRDFWRRGSGDVAVAGRLADTWGNPETLARQIGDPRWSNLPGDFDARPHAPDTAKAEAELTDLRARIAAWDDAALRDADQIISAAFSRASARTPRCKALRKLHDWARALPDPTSDGAALDEARRFDRDACAVLGSFRNHPVGPLFENVRALHTLLGALLPARKEARSVPAAQLLCDARKFLVDERTRRLAERGLMGHDQAVRILQTALKTVGAHVDAAIRQRWKAALIDEFQDSDTAQWEVVRRLFGASTLILVGDPKQAIYGFRGGDVFAWREATGKAAGTPLTLTTSYRSGERLCAAVNALFRDKRAFNDDHIDYRDVTASERSTLCAVLRDGAPLPGLECWSFTAAELGKLDDKTVAKDRARAALERRTVRYLATLLASATLRRGDGGQEPLQPQHVAVLVNDNREAAAMQAALGEAGIPACSNLRASVYASEEADDLALLLEALAEPADADRARAAWASRLLGHSAAEIATSLAGADGAPQRETGEWSDTVRRHSVLMWLHGLVAAAAPRLLALPDGARRVSNYLQLAELLQDDYATCFGPADLAVRFARRRAESGQDDDADSARLRLDTDADAVTVSTVHAAKGLEYDVVVLPYAGFAKDPSRTRKGVALHWYHDHDEARVALGDAAANAEAQGLARGEVLAEDVRKLYVAVTRARALCVLPWGPINAAQHGALFHLLHAAGRGTPISLDDAGCAATLAALHARAPEAIGIVQWDDIPTVARWQAPPPTVIATQPRKFERVNLDRDWSVWSFSRLVRGHHHAAADPLPGTGDGDLGEPGGARFGSAVHEVLERTDFAAWRNTDGMPASQRALIERALADQGVPGAASPHTQEVVGAMLRDALNVRLPCGARLADIAPDARRAEIEFHLALSPADQGKLYALLRQHRYLKQRKGVGATTHLEGLLTGKIDLTFRHASRYYIVDWKTNRCPPYDTAAVAAEIARHDYDLQWILYTLALHRWLGATLADYDYERDFGGVYYLFVRGMQDDRGVHADRPPRALIDALDALLSLPRQEAA